jgi:hypothetical protein
MLGRSVLSIPKPPRNSYVGDAEAKSIIAAAMAKLEKNKTKGQLKSDMEAAFNKRMWTLNATIAMMSPRGTHCDFHQTETFSSIQMVNHIHGTPSLSYWFPL